MNDIRLNVYNKFPQLLNELKEVCESYLGKLTLPIKAHSVIKLTGGILVGFSFYYFG
jgi:hypothetical protein